MYLYFTKHKSMVIAEEVFYTKINSLIGICFFHKKSASDMKSNTIHH